MTFAVELAQRTGVDQERAERAAGSLFAAIKLSGGKELFGAVAAAVPDAAQLIGRARPAAGSRTGEMIAFVSELASERGAAQLGRQLADAGLAPAQVKATVELLLDRLRANGGGAADQLLVRLPGLRHLLA
jgi:hypothetical protein